MLMVWSFESLAQRGVRIGRSIGVKLGKVSSVTIAFVNIYAPSLSKRFGGKAWSLMRLAKCLSVQAKRLEPTMNEFRH